MNIEKSFDTATLGEALQGTGIMQAICHTLSFKAGWWDEYHRMPLEHRKHFLAGRLALMHSEVSEALEGMRKGIPDSHLPHRSSLEVELADTVIRIFDLAGALELDIAAAMLEKLEYNMQRADHKREARNAPGGKSL